ncbi:hypothetical protein GCM10007140_05810 [Priestia taiwanensis]|uniref:Surface layer protein A domain-containing protein n=2 Tax=Priestia taiwanensis TaxID=1347902 RepID=A0A917AKZ8_9BACI|nr:hypothetical protein GCM10007140_05810 [Priestia taiwanensis]
MKKLIASFFVFALSLTAIYAPSASAVGDSRADVFETNNILYNKITVTKSLHNDPSSLAVVNYVSPVQNVKVVNAAFLINSYKGHKWVRLPGEELTSNWYEHKLVLQNRAMIDTGFNASNATLKVSDKRNLYHTAVPQSSEGIPGTVSPQTVDVRQAWYEIETWLGRKWIGYQLR